MNPMSLDSDETLMAFVDGELDAAERAEVELALAGDALLRDRVTALAAQRARLAAAFAPVLDEPMPARLSSLVKTQAPAAKATVSSLDAARAARARPPRPAAVAIGWMQWGGMAASVVLGVLLGAQWGALRSDPSIGLQDGRAVAGGAVERALSAQLASEPLADAPVAVQLSFVDKAGRYCRTFSTGALAGLACRQGGAWAVETFAATAPAASGSVRQAAAALPRAVLDAVDERIDGSALDAAREKAARDQGWQR